MIVRVAGLVSFAFICVVSMWLSCIPCYVLLCLFSLMGLCWFMFFVVVYISGILSCLALSSMFFLWFVLVCDPLQLVQPIIQRRFGLISFNWRLPLIHLAFITWISGASPFGLRLKWPKLYTVDHALLAARVAALICMAYIWCTCVYIYTCRSIVDTRYIALKIVRDGRVCDAKIRSIIWFYS